MCLFPRFVRGMTSIFFSVIRSFFLSENFPPSKYVTGRKKKYNIKVESGRWRKSFRVQIPTKKNRKKFYKQQVYKKKRKRKKQKCCKARKWSDVGKSLNRELFYSSGKWFFFFFLNPCRGKGDNDHENNKESITFS